MMSVCLALSVARSNLHVRHHRADDWEGGRCGRTSAHDADLVADIRRHITDLPTYGYRRACALINRKRRSLGQAPLNHKRIYRVLGSINCCCQKTPGEDIRAVFTPAKSVCR